VVLRNLAAGTLSGLSLWLSTGISAQAQLPPPTLEKPALTIAPARFQLEQHGPVNADPLARDHFGGFPQWYQDKTGLAMELGTAQIQAEIDNAWVIVGPVGLGQTGEFYQFPPAGTFLDEHFYFHAAATGTFPIPAGVDLKNGSLTTDILVELGLEAAFGSGLAEVWGDQWVFARHRIVVRTAPHSGSYLLETPYKNYRIDDQVAGQRIFSLKILAWARCPGASTIRCRASSVPTWCRQPPPGALNCRRLLPPPQGDANTSPTQLFKIS
jgi:hypothetical protein